MLGLKTIRVADNQRVLLYRKNRLVEVLAPGDHRMLDPFGHVSGITYDITQPELKHPMGKFLITAYAELLKGKVMAVDIKSHQIGLVYFDGKLSDILPPESFRIYWKLAVEVEVEVLDIDTEFAIDRRLLPLLVRNRNSPAYQAALKAIDYFEVADNHVGLLNINGKLDKILQPGNYGYWRFNRNIALKLLDCRMQTMEVSGQEILTKDKVSLRINLSASYQVVDTEKVATQLKDHKEFLYREFQLALREVVGTRNLDAILEDKDLVNKVVEKQIKSKAANYGLQVLDLGIKDIILPGDMKSILNQVVEAQKAAEANLIKRREETQATRSLHNTAKVMEGNPTLMRLKELEVLERVTGKIDKLTVYGGIEGVMNDIVRIAP